MVRGVAVISLLALVLAGAAEARTRPVAGAAPHGLKAFVLRADEPVDHSFSRTPSFAWKPVRGAVRYEFQLSTSSAFRENGIVYQTSDLASPAAVIPMSLPWITGNPYSLYARVRAVLTRTITPWSAPFGFNMRWEAVPKPIQTFPGLLRWTPVEGALAYDVWFLDVRKIVRVATNVVDEREYYTFHQTAPWISKVHWRVRAVRPTFVEEGAVQKMAQAPWGPWSPIYESVNPPFPVGPMALGNTVSDVISDGNDAAHRLMPGFTFGGSQSMYGASSELYRIGIYTDRDCVNEVFRGAVVGSPAYAPRAWGGTLALPASLPGIEGSREIYLPNGPEGLTVSYDYVRGVAAESAEPAKPFAKLEPPKPAEGAPALKAEPGARRPPDNWSSIAVDPKVVGAPIDLWDTDWPSGGYYWTVIPVEPTQSSSLTTLLAQSAAAGASTITVSNATGFAAGDNLLIGTGATQDFVSISGITGTTISVTPNLRFAHPAGELVVRSGRVEYRDLELAQEICASGRVKRFGKSSEPSLTSASASFASGLSPSGRLVAASSKRPTFYGHPIVSWTPALGAWAYQVQWSKTRYPFRAELHPTLLTPGLLAVATSATLPVSPGAWYYRVRGINYQLAEGSQQMSWSDPAKVVVVRPKFEVVGR
jgi:hypothetical protein